MCFLNVFFLRACKLCKVNVNKHMLSLQLLVNQECRTTNLDSYANQSRFTSDCTHVITYTCIHMHNCTKIKHFHVLKTFPSCQYIETILLEKNKLRARFELAFSRTGVLDLDHYTTADYIFILLTLKYIEFQKT